jgi:hypothetical protein
MSGSNQVGSCAGLTPGQTYTMTLTEGGLGLLATAAEQAIGSAASSVQSSLNGCAGVDIASNISVTQTCFGLSNFQITFQYSGDGTDSATDVFNEFANALESLGTSWSYVGTVTGGPTNCALGNAQAATVSAAKAVAKTACNIANSPSSLWAIAIIGIIAVFVLSGGVGAARSIGEAA